MYASYNGLDFNSKSTEVNYYTQRQMYQMLGISPSPTQEHFMDGFLQQISSTHLEDSLVAVVLFALWVGQDGGDVTLYADDTDILALCEVYLGRFSDALNIPIEHIILTHNKRKKLHKLGVWKNGNGRWICTNTGTKHEKLKLN